MGSNYLGLGGSDADFQQFLTSSRRKPLSLDTASYLNDSGSLRDSASPIDSYLGEYEEEERKRQEAQDAADKAELQAFHDKYSAQPAAAPAESKGPGVFDSFVGGVGLLAGAPKAALNWGRLLAGAPKAALNWGIKQAAGAFDPEDSMGLQASQDPSGEIGYQALKYNPLLMPTRLLGEGAEAGARLAGADKAADATHLVNAANDQLLRFGGAVGTDPLMAALPEGRVVSAIAAGLFAPGMAQDAYHGAKTALDSNLPAEERVRAGVDALTSAGMLGLMGGHQLDANVLEPRRVEAARAERVAAVEAERSRIAQAAADREAAQAAEEAARQGAREKAGITDVYSGAQVDPLLAEPWRQMREPGAEAKDFGFEVPDLEIGQDPLNPEAPRQTTPEPGFYQPQVDQGPVPPIEQAPLPIDPLGAPVPLGDALHTGQPPTQELLEPGTQRLGMRAGEVQPGRAPKLTAPEAVQPRQGLPTDMHGNTITEADAHMSAQERSEMTARMRAIAESLPEGRGRAAREGSPLWGTPFEAAIDEGLGVSKIKDAIARDKGNAIESFLRDAMLADDARRAKPPGPLGGGQYEDPTVPPPKPELTVDEIQAAEDAGSTAEKLVEAATGKAPTSDLPTIPVKEERGPGVERELIQGFIEDHPDATREQIVEELKRVREIADRDEMTGAKNRDAYLRDTRDAPPPPAVSEFDIAGVGKTNKAYGEHYADAMLSAAGRTLVRLVGDRGTVYRKGGDEFVVHWNDHAEGAKSHAALAEALANAEVTVLGPDGQPEAHWQGVGHYDGFGKSFRDASGQVYAKKPAEGSPNAKQIPPDIRARIDAGRANPGGNPAGGAGVRGGESQAPGVRGPEPAQVAPRTPQELASHLAREFPYIRRMISKVGPDGVEITTPSGRKITVRDVGHIEISQEAAARGYGERASMEGLQAMGATSIVGQDALVRLVDRGELPHEMLHVFKGLFATKAEQRYLDREYEREAKERGFSGEGASEEAAAEIYKDYHNARKAAEARGEVYEPKTFLHRVLGRMYEFFRDLYRGWFPNQESIFRGIYEGRGLERGAKPGAESTRYAVRNGKVGMGTDPRLIKVLARTMYKGDVGEVIVKEAIQNAVDAIKGLGDKTKRGKITVDVNTRDKIINVRDNGIGMTPETMSKELVDIGSTLKLNESGDALSDSVGGLGLAKVAIFANSDAIEVISHTKAKGGEIMKDGSRAAKGDLIRTTLTGSGDDWVNGNMQMETVPSNFASGTGTQMRLVLSPDAELGWGAEDFLQKFENSHRLPIDTEFKVNSYAIDKPAAHDIDQFDTDTIETPGAKAEIHVSQAQSSYEDSGVKVKVLNNGMPQFEEYVPLGANAKMPRSIIMDVHARVKPEDGGYPFMPNRQELRGDIQEQLRDYVKNKLAANSIRRQNQALTDALDAGVDIPKARNKDPQVRLMGTNGVPEHELTRLAADPATQTVAPVIARMFNSLRDHLAKFSHNQVANWGNVELHGLDTNPTWLGVNFGTRGLGHDNNRVLINPWGIAHVASAESGLRGVDPNRLFTQKIADTIIHELTHQNHRGIGGDPHGERFSSPFGLNSAYSLEEQALWARKLMAEMQRAGVTYEDFAQQFQSLSRHQGATVLGKIAASSAAEGAGAAEVGAGRGEAPEPGRGEPLQAGGADGAGAMEAAEPGGGTTRYALRGKQRAEFGERARQALSEDREGERPVISEAADRVRSRIAASAPAPEPATVEAPVQLNRMQQAMAKREGLTDAQWAAKHPELLPAQDANRRLQAQLAEQKAAAERAKAQAPEAGPASAVGQIGAPRGLFDAMKAKGKISDDTKYALRSSPQPQSQSGFMPPRGGPHRQAQNTLLTPRETGFDKFVKKVYDKTRRATVIVQAIRQAGIAVPEGGKTDISYGVRQLPGQAGNALRQLATRDIDPIVQTLAKEGLSLDGHPDSYTQTTMNLVRGFFGLDPKHDSQYSALTDHGRYLESSHGPGRNAAILQRDPQNPAGSGATDAEWQQHLEALDRESVRRGGRNWSKVHETTAEKSRNVNDRVLFDGIRSGRLNADTLAQWWQGFGNGFEDRLNTMVQRGVLTRAEADGFRQRAIDFREKQIHDLETKGWIGPDDVRVYLSPADAATLRAVGATGRDWVPLRHELVDLDEHTGTGSGISLSRTESPKARGRSTQADNPIAMMMHYWEQSTVRDKKNVPVNQLRLLAKDLNDPTVLSVKEDVNYKYGQKPPDNAILGRDGGKLFEVTVADPVLLKVFKNASAQGMFPEVAQVFSKFTRGFTQMVTGLSPEFWITNKMRDIPEMAINLSRDYDKSVAQRALKLAATGKIGHAIRSLEKDPAYAGQYADAVREYQKHGGPTGRFGIPTAEELHRDVNQLLAKEGSGLIPWGARTSSKFFQTVEHWNGALENSTRVAAYIAVKDHLRSQNVPEAQAIRRAIQAAKEATVNFDQRGEWGPSINSMYAFFGAGASGTARMVKTLSGKKGAALAAGLVGFGIAMDQMNARAAGDKDGDGINDYDQVPDFLKQRTLMGFGVPGVFTSPKPLMMPLPYGFGAIINIGRNISARARGAQTSGAAASSVTSGLAGAFNPLDSADLNQMIAPTALDPFVQWVENKDWAGRPIHPELLPGQHKPASELHFKTANPASVKLTKWLNTATGGDEVTSGVVDINPEFLDHVISYFGGGVGTAGSKLMSAAGEASRGELPSVRNLPFARKVVYEPHPGQENSIYRANSDRLDELWDRYKHYQTTGDTDKAKTIPVELLRTKKAVDSIASQIKGIRRAGSAVPNAEDRVRALMVKANRMMASAFQSAGMTMVSP